MRKYILTQDQAQALKHYVACQMRNVADCDGTFKYTKQWLDQNVPAERHDEVIEEMQSDGGFCDCEVLINCYNDFPW